MSHFTCLVVGDDWEDQLAAFDEDLVVASYRVDLDDDEMKDLIKFGQQVGEVPHAYTDADVRSWMPAYIGGFDHYYSLATGADTPHYYTTANPNARWDWYVIGGRWRGYFKLKVGRNGLMGRSGTLDNPPQFDADQCRVGDVDWGAMKMLLQNEALEHWNAFFDAETDIPRQIHVGESKGDFTRRYSRVATHALLQDGEWLEQSLMGWWGIKMDEKVPEDRWEEEWLERVQSLPENTLITLVDCHI